MQPRVVGVDIARFLALVGMMATHILAAVENGELTLAQEVAGGRASALFAVLAGVSIALMTGRTTPPRGRGWPSAAVVLTVRALLIGLLGLVLGGIETGIAVILTYYALLFLLAVPFLTLRARPLAVLAGAWLLLAPAVSHLLRPRLPDPSYDSPSFGALADPLQLLSELTFTGYYPAFPWLAYLLAGMAIGRTDLSRWRTTAMVGGLGVLLVAASWVVSATLLARPGVMATLGRTFTGPGELGTMDLTLAKGLYGTTPTGSWWWLAVRAPHTATPFDLAQTIGSALVVISVCLVVGRLASRVTGVLFGAGAMTLTLYSLHVALRSDGWWDGHTTGTWAGQVVAVVLVGAAYRLARRRGPLETAVGVTSQAAGRMVGGRTGSG